MTIQTIVESVRMRFPEASPGWIATRIDLIQKSLLGATGTIAAVVDLDDPTKVSISISSDISSSAVSIESIEALDLNGTAIPTAFQYVIDRPLGTIQLYDSAGVPLESWPGDVVTVRIHYNKKPTTITPATSTSTVPDLPEEFHHIFEESILEILYSEVPNAIAAGMHRTRAKEIALDYRRYFNTRGDNTSWKFAPGPLDRM